MKKQPCSYGIIAVIWSGSSPEDDEAHFDRWYSSRGLAESMFEYYKKQYPHHDVFLVVPEKAAERGMRKPKMAPEDGSFSTLK
jgi:hypothetical protein